MTQKMTQEQRLAWLVEAFKTDAGRADEIATPGDTKGRRRILRVLMNVRMPAALPEETLCVQDEYLQERARQKGVVSMDDLPVQRDGISLWQGDITRLAADAIVNAANSQMLGCFVPLHACIDNCIHTYAGVQLRAECSRRMDALRRQYGPNYEQPTAVPMLTDAYNLPARKVIHVVGPIVDGALTPEHERQLADCYRNTLELCRQNDLHSVAFCCISTGVFCFPNQRAAEIAVDTVRRFLRETGSGIRVVFNVFKDMDREIYERLLA